MKRIATILLFFYFFGPAWSQSNRSTDMYVHFNQSFYLAGEHIRFNLFLGDISIGPGNKNNEIILCALYSPDGSRVINHTKLETFRGHADGHLQIPALDNDGFYPLVIYGSGQAYNFLLPIYNGKTHDPSPHVPVEKEPLNVFRQGPLQLSIEGNKTTYHPREKVEFELSVKGGHQFTYVSVNVYDQRNYFYRPLESMKQSPQASSFEPVNDVYGEVFLKKDSSLLKNKLIVGYFIKNKQFSGAFSNEKGEVLLNLNMVNGKDLLYLNAFEVNNNRIGEAFIRSSEMSIPLTRFSAEKIPQRNTEVEAYIRKRTNINQINEAFKATGHAAYGSPAYVKPPYVITRKMDDYATMASFRDACREFIPNTIVRNNRKTGKDEIFLLEWGENKRFNDTPLFLINGIPTLSSDTVLNLDYHSIDRVEVMVSPQTISDYWQMGVNGVLSITLKEGIHNPLDKNLSILPETNGLNKPLSFALQDHHGKITTSPDFRPHLYWNPNLTIGKNESIPVSFYSADDITDYVIEVFGLSEKGVPGYLVEKFSVIRPGQ